MIDRKNEKDKIIIKRILKEFVSSNNYYNLKKKGDLENLSLRDYIIYCYNENMIEEIESVSQKEYRKNNRGKETSPELLDYKTTISGLMYLASS